jgi:hypothetical protein
VKHYGHRLCIIVIFVAGIWLFNVGCVHWSSEVSSDSNSWTIYRESGTIKFHQEGIVEGNISPIEINADGRILSPHNAYYADYKVNDIRLKERINAREGYYRTEDDLTINASAEDEIKVLTKKPFGGIYAITYAENWPTYIGVGRFIIEISLEIIKMSLGLISSIIKNSIAFVVLIWSLKG